ncbi:hypothetical protein CYLTODRAFT_367970 [Cylindrobasidium torrendii FP15055 ss-10]|uniref:Uncharacterized protein n=1 Tax=Cylindrobasidium torrendii FP15055 ss-10 TaxID=1314674 RepID=A0A0D7BRB2_9AGAR|nr:hypothetical protein CYLTODRAFT_367970 [Cylindrobasidium torrendii FP15055 ss-10]
MTLSSVLSRRALHVSAVRAHLVGPPHPISHIRPVIYDDVPTPPPPSLLPHPYSLAEFDPDPPPGSTSHDMQWKLQRQQLDDLDQNFWMDSNIRFEMGKAAVLESLPPTASQIDKENALSEFYKQWVLLQGARTDEYTEEWRARNVKSLQSAIMAHISKISKVFTFAQ